MVNWKYVKGTGSIMATFGTIEVLVYLDTGVLQINGEHKLLFRSKEGELSLSRCMDLAMAFIETWQNGKED